MARFKLHEFLFAQAREKQPTRRKHFSQLPNEIQFCSANKLSKVLVRSTKLRLEFYHETVSFSSCDLRVT